MESYRRLQYQNVVDDYGRWTGRLELSPGALKKPLARRKPTYFFVNSMSDLFHPQVSFNWLDQIFNVIDQTRHHTYQILTKRAMRMADMMPLIVERYGVLPNVWLGVSVENRSKIDRIKLLEVAPAAIKFVSFEPLLEDIGDIDLTGINWAIVGAESGPKARPMDEDWVRRIRDICLRDRVNFFYKQQMVGGRKVSTPALDGVVWNEIPF